MIIRRLYFHRATITRERYDSAWKTGERDFRQSVNFSHPVRNNFISTAFSILNLRFSRDLKVPLEFPWNKILFLDRIRNDYIRFIYLFISFPPPATRELEILGDVEPASPCHESRAIETRHLSLSLSPSREIRKRDFPWPWPMIFSSCTRTDCLTPII